jgi:hypothetical protein
MRKCLFCLGLIGYLGMQNTAFAAPVGVAASLIARPGPSGTIEKVYYYHHHYYPYRYRGHYYHHRSYRHGHWHYY